MKKCLILHSDNSIWPDTSKYNHLYAGIWCLEKIKGSFINNNYEIVKVNNNLQEQNIRYYLIVKAYRNALPLIAEKLNRLHNIEFSSKSWEIIIGPWLRQTLGILVERYRTIENAYKNYKFETIQISENIDISSKNTIDLIQYINKEVNECWNYNIYSKIILYLKTKNKEIIKADLKISKKNILSKTKINVRYYIKKFFINFINLFNSRSKFVIYKINFDFINQLKFFFYLKQLPKIIITENYNFKKIEYKIRNQIFFEKSEKKNFYNFFLSILPELIPTDFVENFMYLKKKTKSLKSYDKSKVIITSHGYASDELFKTWLSINRHRINYYVLQHGNSYFTSKYSLIQPDLDLSDKFISWGDKVSLKKNVLQFYNLNNYNFKNLSSLNVKRNKNKKIFIYCRGINSFRYRPHDDYSDMIDCYNQINLSLKFLNSEIKKNVYLKLYPHYDLNLKNKIFDEVFTENNNILQGNYKKKDIYKSSKLIIHSGDTTGFLETLSLEIPTLTYIPNFYMIRKNVLKDYMELKKVGIIFDEGKKLAEHINNIFCNVEKWWFDKEVTNARNNFTHKYSKNNESNKDLVKLTANLIKTTNDK